MLVFCQFLVNDESLHSFVLFSFEVRGYIWFKTVDHEIQYDIPMSSGGLAQVDDNNDKHYHHQPCLSKN